MPLSDPPFKGNAGESSPSPLLGSHVETTTYRWPNVEVGSEPYAPALRPEDWDDRRELAFMAMLAEVLGTMPPERRSRALAWVVDRVWESTTVHDRHTPEVGS